MWEDKQRKRKEQRSDGQKAKEEADGCGSVYICHGAETGTEQQVQKKMKNTPQTRAIPTYTLRVSKKSLRSFSWPFLYRYPH